MAENNGGWGDLISDLAVLEAEGDDDSEFAEDEDFSEDEDSDEGFDVEAFRRGGRRTAFARRKPPHRARPTRSYTQQVKGRGQGLVQTPNGPARIELPGKFPTVDEFRKTVGEIQKDMKENSTGIKELAEQQKKDSVRLAEMVVTSEKKLRKQMKRTQVISAIFALAPLAVNVISEFKKP